MTLEELSDKFRIAYNEISTDYKKRFIENEMEEILKLVDDLASKERKTARLKSYAYGKEPNHVFNIETHPGWAMIFINSFNDYRNKGIQASYNREDIQEDVEQAYALVDYYKWLERNLTPSEEKPQPKEVPLNLEQKLIALHSLGLNTASYNKTQLSKVLQQVLGTRGSGTIRQILSSLDTRQNQVRSLENLNKVRELLEHKSFERPQERLDEEIKRY